MARVKCKDGLEVELRAGQIWMTHGGVRATIQAVLSSELFALPVQVSSGISTWWLSPEGRAAVGAPLTGSPFPWELAEPVSGPGIDDIPKAETDALAETAKKIWEKADFGQFDTVARPKHYVSGKIEVWDFIVDQNLPYLAGNVVKYVCRYRHKGKPVEDLKKARAYIDRLLREVEGADGEASKNSESV